ncbi:MAG TPA: sigma-70 family RNA polymerase sigma factor [Kofleriaceae bacterium]|nr:sigma-70 family RNA polymerase sigma factor [Kofleriaceae bacterium]
MSARSACCCGDWVAGLAHDHARRLAAIARHEGLSAADALDAVQDAFYTLLQRPGARELPAEDAARLLSTITRNAARNLRRRHHRARPHDELDETLATDDTPVAALDRAEVGAQLAGCMAKLGDAHRHVVTLRVLEELSGEEAAAALGITPNHVGVLLHRARKELERCMLTGP